ncbi:MAG: T9SS type A sorting domain-containing protein [Bacteroidales bacterium]
MKTISLSFLFLLTFAGTAAAQSAVIGTGTANTNGNIADPTERYYQYERFQIVYTAEELTTAGMPAGAMINALGFSITQSAVSLANYTIDLGHTTHPIADPYIPEGLTTVRSPFIYTPVVQAEGNFDMIPFTTAFAWDGVSNLVVNTCTGSNPFISPYGGLRYTPATLGSVRHILNDGGNYCAIATVTNSAMRPNIRFDYTPGTGGCYGTPDPGNTLASPNPVCSGLPFTLSLQTAILGTGVSYQWQYSADGQEPWINTGVSSTELVTTQTTATWYRCLVTCGILSGTSSPVLVEMTGNAFDIYYVAGFDDATICYGATNEIIVADFDEPYSVLPGGEVTMIAGMSIIFLPGTTVQLGGHLLGYINPCGPYCEPPASKHPRMADREYNPMRNSERHFSVMPNPTTGDFLLELKGDTTPAEAIICITGTTGELVLPKARMTGSRQSFSLSYLPTGIYFVRVISGDVSECAKIVKY